MMSLKTFDNKIKKRDKNIIVSVGYKDSRDIVRYRAWYSPNDGGIVRKAIFDKKGKLAVLDIFSEHQVHGNEHLRIPKNGESPLHIEYDALISKLKNCNFDEPDESEKYFREFCGVIMKRKELEHDH